MMGFAPEGNKCCPHTNHRGGASRGWPSRARGLNRVGPKHSPSACTALHAARTCTEACACAVVGGAATSSRSRSTAAPAGDRNARWANKQNTSRSRASAPRPTAADAAAAERAWSYTDGHHLRSPLAKSIRLTGARECLRSPEIGH